MKEGILKFFDKLTHSKDRSAHIYRVLPMILVIVYFIDVAHDQNSLFYTFSKTFFYWLGYVFIYFFADIFTGAMEEE